ncbi:MAG: hypothetical protein PHT80_01420, partial [Lentisphaeria bacterium]|nr:hypothetical protein [Lentisphaeria bacterium]
CLVTLLGVTWLRNYGSLAFWDDCTSIQSTYQETIGRFSRHSRRALVIKPISARTFNVRIAPPPQQSVTH